MSTYTQILYHIVFSTKGRLRSINTTHRKEILNYIWGILKNNKCFVLQMELLEDHIHILTSIHLSVSLSDLIRSLKLSSNKFISENGLGNRFDG